MITCEHCGAALARTQNDISKFFCGSSYCDKFLPRWMRSKECMEAQIKLLKEKLERKHNDVA